MAAVVSVVVLSATSLAGAAAAGGAPATPDRIRLAIGQYNLPGEDKLPRAEVRAARAAAAIRAADLDVVTLNEMVGPSLVGGVRVPSAFAVTLVDELGSRWRLVTPTSEHNENYLVYRSDRLSVVTQHPDQVVPAVRDPETGEIRRSTARHVTPVLLEDAASRQRLLVAATHLVDGDRAGARQQAYAVGEAVSRLAEGDPVVVAGDVNTSDLLAGLTGSGLKDARRSTSRRVDPTYRTYVPYSWTKPRKDLSRVIDQIYVPQAWTVDRWVTKLPVRNGRFTTPRASDHMLVWAEVSGPPV